MPQESMAKRVNPVATWDNVMLADETLRLLRTLASQARENQSERGGSGGAQGSDSRHGMIAIFTGESDADKTAAAEVLANDLDVKLYRIDLSSVASKWIWETEKNLSRLLSAAEEGDTILFFDEADALFGNRTSVGDDHNRYTSREAGFVMQLLETHRGLSILATSKPSNLDPAFTRRIRFIVAFEPPGQAERERIWASAFPAGVPTDDLDVRLLAQLNISGALIHSIALQASSVAASTGSIVTTDSVLEVARREMRKLDRPINQPESP